MLRFAWHRASAPLRWLRRRPADRAIRVHLAAPLRPPPADGVLSDQVAVMMSHRIQNPDRLAMLAVSIEQLAQGLHPARPQVVVVDASEGRLAEDAKALWSQSGLDVHVESAPMRLGQAYVHLLESIEQPHVYLQFDDMLTAGLSPEFLGDAASFLQRHRGFVDVVSVPWCMEPTLEDDDRVIDVVSKRRRPSGAYDFHLGGKQKPIAIDQLPIGPFGIFRNFDYGFFLHNLVAPTDDLHRRLSWYLAHVSATSVHAIEMATRNQLRGPSWPHIGICLAGVALLDIDFAHTTEAVRPENPALRERSDLLRSGWQVRTRVDHVT